jgi:hypothetical protein
MIFLDAYNIIHGSIYRSIDDLIKLTVYLWLHPAVDADASGLSW